MSEEKPRGHRPAEPSGPVVAWCAGHRCTALRRLNGGAGQDERIRTTVKNTPGAVLMSFPCLGRCELAGVAATGRRNGTSGQIGPMVWFTGLEDPDRFEALQAWIAGGGPRHLHHPAGALPAALGEAVCGTSPPPQIRRG